MSKDSSNPKGKPSEIPLVQWAAAGFGMLVFAAMLALLAAEEFRSAPTVPPMMKVDPVRLIAGDGEYVLEVIVRNRSRKTGANVQIEGDLSDGSVNVETSNATLDYVPGESHRPAGLVFKRDPRRFHVDLRVTGYERP